MEELNDNLLFRWFVGLNMDDPVWHPTTFTKNRDRLLSGDVAAAFFDAVQAHARAAGLLSDEHFTGDGTQLEAWARLKSFRYHVDRSGERLPARRTRGNPTVNFHGERRRNRRPMRVERPIPRRCCIAEGQRQGSQAGVSRPQCCWTIDRGLSPTSASTHFDGDPPNATRRCCCWRPAPPRGSTGRGGHRATMWRASLPTCDVQDVTPHVAQKVRGSRDRRSDHAGGAEAHHVRSAVRNENSWNRSSAGPEDRRRPAQASGHRRHRPRWIGMNHLRRHRL